MISGNITFENCQTLDDVKYAVQEALKRIARGNTSGFDKNSMGQFEFTVSGEEAEYEDEDDDEDDDA